MILKGSQRAGGQNLATHLMNMDDNEHVRVYELRGFVSDTLHGAFKEAEAISKATRCTEYLFSLSLNAPAGENPSEQIFEAALARIEQKLGLEGQPRAVVFHEKEGRCPHMHCVWSRIDAASLTARPMPFFKNRLMEVSRELYLQNGWKMPRGFTNAAERDPTNFSLAEWQQAKRQGIDPRWLKSTLQSCWASSDNAQSLSASLNRLGFALATGDRRSHVVIDHTGEVYALSRMLDRKTKEIRDRLGDGDDLPDVATIKAQISERMVPALRRHVAEAQAQFAERTASLGQRKAELTQSHRAGRSAMNQRHKIERATQTLIQSARLPKGMRGLWHRLTGQYQEVRRQNERDAARSLQRQADERHKLIQDQLAERQALQSEFRDLRSKQAAQLLDLRRDVGRFLKLSSPQSMGQRRARGLGLGLER